MVIQLLNEDDETESALLKRALSFAGTVVASDSMPLVPTAADFDPLQWPLSGGAITHPRSAGCFSRVLRLWREQGRPLSDAIRRCSLLPAKLLEASCASMGAKGRIRPGADADLVVFDPVRVTDQATYAHTTCLSSGVRHVLVDGVFVIRDGELVEQARPGRLITSNARGRLFSSGVQFWRSARNGRRCFVPAKFGDAAICALAPSGRRESNPHDQLGSSVLRVLDDLHAWPKRTL